MKNNKAAYIDKIQKFYRAGTELRVRAVRNGFVVRLEPRYEENVGGGAYAEEEIVCANAQEMVDVLLEKLTYKNEVSIEENLAKEIEIGRTAVVEVEALTGSLESVTAELTTARIRLAEFNDVDPAAQQDGIEAPDKEEHF